MPGMSLDISGIVMTASPEPPDLYHQIIRVFTTVRSLLMSWLLVMGLSVSGVDFLVGIAVAWVVRVNASLGCYLADVKRLLVGVLAVGFLALFGCGRGQDAPQGPSDEEWTARLNEAACAVPHVVTCELKFWHFRSSFTGEPTSPRVSGSVSTDSDDVAVNLRVLDEVARSIAVVLVDETSEQNSASFAVTSISGDARQTLKELDGFDFRSVTFDELVARYGLERKRR